MPTETSTAELRARDTKAREVIQSALDENVMVLAGAGAGKTYEMVRRMTNLVRRGTPVREIAAITFTRKAAGEMRARFFKWLRQEVQTAPPEAQQHLQAALAEVDQCFIGTIHSFCARLLRERSLEVGLPPDFSQMDEREEVDLRRTAWRRYRRRCGEEALVRLEAKGLQPDDLFDFFCDLCDYPDLALHAPEVEAPDLTAAVEAVRAFVEEALSLVPESPIHEKGYDKCQETLRWADRFLRLRGFDGPADRAAFLQKFLRVGSRKQTDDGVEWKIGSKIKYNRWGASGSEAYNFAKVLKKERLPELLEEHVYQPLCQWREHTYAHAAAFVEPAVEAYRKLRLTEGKLTFGDLLMLTRDLLRDHPEARAYFQRRYRHLFVDEFQDTDPIQAEILFYLTDPDRLEETDWTQLRPRPGSLFLVGDGKQSIYRFRRADYETFRLVQQRFEETGRIVELQRSFRTYENLCQWVNRSFPEIFERHEAPYQAPFEKLLHIEQVEGVEPQADDHDRSRLRTITVPYKYRDSASKIAEDDAERIARFIAALVRGDETLREEYADLLPVDELGYGDFMILTRRKKRLDTYAAALEAAGVPYDVTGAEALGELEELEALVHLMEAVRRPQNPVPLIAFLRGPLAGISDRALYRYRQAGGCFHYRAEVPEELGEEAEAFRDAFGLLRMAARLFRTLPPRSALESLLAELGQQAHALGKPLGSSRAGGLKKILALAREIEAQGGSWVDLHDELHDLHEDDAFTLEGLTLEAGGAEGAGAVRVMNLHKAKGLQAKVVFLADPYNSRAKNHDPAFYVSRTGEGEPFVAIPVKKKEGRYNRRTLCQPAGWDEMEAREAEFLKAEERRLLYVAATRASHLLVLSQYEGKKSCIKDGYWGSLNPCFEEAPELERPPLPEKEEEAVAVDMDAVNRHRQALRKRLEEKTYRQERVTDGTTAEDLEPNGSGGSDGKGRTYGTLVHELLEAFIEGQIGPEEAPGHALGLARRQGLQEQYAEDAVAALERFTASALWTELQAARSSGAPVLTEVPFTHAAEEHGVRKLKTGQIDLAYRDQDGWHIVDFKTGRPGRELEERYRTQLAEYEAAWEALTGESVASAKLWSADAEA